MVEEVKVEKTTANKRMWGIIAGLLTLVVIIVLVVIKLNNENFKIGYVFLIGGILIIISTILFFSSEIMSYVNKDKDEKDSFGRNLKMNIDEAREFLRLKLEEDYTDYVKISYKSPITHKGKDSKSAIFYWHFLSLYGNKYLTAINLYDPKRYSFVKNPIKNDFVTIIRDVAIDPEDKPDTEIIERENPFGGRELIKRTSKHKDKKKEDDKKGDVK